MADDGGRGPADFFSRFIWGLVVLIIATSVLQAMLPTLIVLGSFALFAYVVVAIVRSRRDRW